MSRAERERRQLMLERWSHLKDFLAGDVGVRFAGCQDGLAKDLAAFVDPLSLDVRIQLATECKDFRDYFRSRYDEGRFLADAVDVTDLGRIGERNADSRIALLYSILASSIRSEIGDWKP